MCPAGAHGGPGGLRPQPGPGDGPLLRRAAALGRAAYPDGECLAGRLRRGNAGLLRPLRRGPAKPHRGSAGALPRPLPGPGKALPFLSPALPRRRRGGAEQAGAGESPAPRRETGLFPGAGLQGLHGPGERPSTTTGRPCAKRYTWPPPWGCGGASSSIRSGAPRTHPPPRKPQKKPRSSHDDRGFDNQDQ